MSIENKIIPVSPLSQRWGMELPTTGRGLDWEFLSPVLFILTKYGYTNREIAIMLETTEGAVKSGIHRLTAKGIEIPGCRPNKVDPDAVLSLLQNGGTTYTIARQLNVHPNTVGFYKDKFRNTGVLNDYLPSRWYIQAARNVAICLLSEGGYTAQQIVEYFENTSPTLNVSLKIVEGVRAKWIKTGKISRHSRKLSPNPEPININEL